MLTSRSVFLTIFYVCVCFFKTFINKVIITIGKKLYMDTELIQDSFFPFLEYRFDKNLTER